MRQVLNRLRIIVNITCFIDPRNAAIPLSIREDFSNSGYAKLLHQRQHQHSQTSSNTLTLQLGRVSRRLLWRLRPLLLQ